VPDTQTSRPRLSRDSIGNTLFVAIGVSFVCSVLVASAAVILKPRQQLNEEQFRQQIILDIAGLYEPGADIAELYSSIEEQTITLGSGKPATVYLVKDGDRIEQLVLPVEGSGLWGMMYGFLAVANDGNTVLGLQFYDHGETPGLGDQVDRPAWRAKWVGKKLYAADGTPQVEIIKGQAPAGSDHLIDGMAGATLTGRGVTTFIRYWIGEDGYGPYLKQLNRTDDRS
jgi:Na+-transporting NADH:ubiquinone oxidoreductase subunit C